MIHLHSVSVQAAHLMETGQIGHYDAQMLSQWVIRSWSGVGSLTLELAQGAVRGTLFERYICCLTLSALLCQGVNQAWNDFVCVMNACEKVETNQECPICFEKINDGIQLKCAHMYHDDCIQHWFEKKTTCPMCRYDILSG